MLLSLLVALAPSLPAAPLPSQQEFAGLIPEDSFFVLLADDLQGMGARAETNSWWRMLQDPAFQDVYTSMRDGLRASWAEDEPDFDPFDELPRLARVVEDLAVVLQLPDGVAGRPVLTVLLRHAVEDAEAVATLDQLVAQVLDGVELTPEDVPGLEGGLRRGDGLAIYREQGMLALVHALGDDGELGGEVDAARVADRIDPVTAVADGLMDALADPGPQAFDGGLPLTATEAYRASRDVADLAVEVFVDLGAALESMVYDGDLPEDAVMAMEDAGLPEMGRMHMAMDVGPGEQMDFVLRLDVGPGSALDRLLAYAGEIDPGVLALLPGNAMSVSVVTVDLVGAYEELQLMVDEYDPTGGEARAAVDIGLMVAETSLTSGVAEILELFDGTVATVTLPLQEDLAVPVDEGGDLELLLPEGLFAEVYAVGLADPEGFTDWVGDALAANDMESLLQTRETDAGAVFTLEEEGSPMSWAVREDVLFASPFADLVETALGWSAEDGPTAAASERFAGFDELAQGCLSAAMTDTASMARQLLTTVQALEVLFGLGPAGGSLPWPDPAIIDSYLEGRIRARTVRVGSVIEASSRAR